MREAQIYYRSMELGYEVASKLATSYARRQPEVGTPVIVAWFDRNSARASHPDKDSGSWRDYGASHGGKLDVNVNDEFEFIFADASDFESYGPSPYINLRDPSGNEYVCRKSAAHDPLAPNLDACEILDEWTSKMT